MRPKALVAGMMFCAAAVCLAAANRPAPRPPQRLWTLTDFDQLFDVSPDGKLAAYIDWKTDGNLVVRDLATGSTRDLTKKTVHDDEAEIARFSPDGKRILFNWWDSKAQLDEFRTIGIDGSDLKTVYRAPRTGTVLWPSMWTADGTSILLWVSHKDSNRVKQSSSLALVASAGGAPRLIPGTSDAGEIISADGRFIAGIRRDRPEIVIIGVADGREVARIPSSSSVTLIRFTSDGLVFSSDRGGSPGVWRQPLTNGKPQGEPHLVRGDLWGLREVFLDAVGRLYYEINAGDRDAYMVNIDLETGRTRSQPMPLSKAPGADYFSPQFSPDGKYVAMTTRRVGEGKSAAVLIRSLAGDEVREFPVATFAGSAQWIPGSQALALTVYDSTRDQDLVRLDLASGERRTLVRRARSPLAFAPDGKILYYTPSVHTDSVVRRVVARELVTGTERTVYTAPSGSSVLASAVSRDGKTLMVALVHRLSEHPYKILAITIPSGAVRDLSAAVPAADTANGGQRALGFTADLAAQILLAPKLDGAHTLTLWRVPLSGGAVTELGPAPKGIEFNNRQTAGAWLSPDATRLVYIGGTLKSELWMIDEPALRAELAARH
ncbi:MAG TPA: hypothetical protein VE967_11850 [Gemmatimonadaceae bacterium]|nr:hypothetical protein [Gemmatimonadaceae bacterium]